MSYSTNYNFLWVSSATFSNTDIDNLKETFKLNITRFNK